MSETEAVPGAAIGRGIRVLDDRVLVRRDRPADRSRGGIVIPDQAQDLPDEGRVVQLGPGRWEKGESWAESPDDTGASDPIQHYNRVEPSVRAGDKVVFARHSGATIRHEGEDLVVLRESDIIAVVEDLEST
jgi:chaperonin GroES